MCIDGHLLNKLLWFEGLNTLNICLSIIRRHIVIGGFLGYSVGVLLALNLGGTFTFPLILLSYLAVFFGDLSTHFSNDYYDVDLDRKALKKTFGGSNLLVKHPKIRPLAFRIALVLSLLSVLTSLIVVLVFSASVYLLLIVIIANLFGWLYSTPPLRLNARGFGEIIISLGTGFTVPTIGYLATLRSIDWTFLRFSVPLMLYGFILSLSQEMPDREVDRENGKLNLVVLMGRRSIALLIFLLAVIATGYIIAYVSSMFRHFWVLPLLSLAPLVAGLRGFHLRSETQIQTNQNSAIIIYALFFFLVTLNGYLLLSL